MYIAMNRFRVKLGNEDAFEEVWRNRERRLSEMDGFVEFQLLKGPEREDHTLYASHTVWRDKDTFLAWTKSQAFRDAHKNAGGNKPLYLGPPEFEGFEAVISETA
ncbi:antibiotic biosynthesis monooxygenase [Stappia sp. MMSF_3263]|uniref:antibiotic biosynthesis monooxygenase family protein n=1 Tax=Stappia sp. MMSF_3263 TaxID=3046693 RepID=UPI00273CF965|nr:antibiotic biosynthesis monooxygenase [Stappia sp. MMSF_3263]